MIEVSKFLREPTPFEAAAELNKAMRSKRAIEMRLYLRRKGRCAYCGLLMWMPKSGRKKRGFVMTVDHVVARSKGGANKADNYVGACANCNWAKGSRSAEEFVASSGCTRRVNRLEEIAVGGN